MQVLRRVFPVRTVPPMALVPVLLLTAGCGRQAGFPAAGAASLNAARTEPPAVGFQLVEASAARGVSFRHSATTRTPLTIVDTMGGGCAFFDFDGDGRQDIFLVNSGQEFRNRRQIPGSRLYRNTGNGFEDVTAASGILIDGYAMGCCAGDYDNDGHDDLFVTGFRQDWLFRNCGKGAFQDVSRQAGLLRRPGAWGVGAAFVDVNRDGLLDLYVGNYVRYSPSIPYCRTANIIHGCTPNQYSTQANELYINRGGGKFVEQAARWGAEDSEGASLGVMVCDYDDDGWPDIFVANDGTPNALLHNEHGRFKDVAETAGVAYGEDGVMRAGMGVGAGDLDGDGRFEILVTNWQTEPTSVFRNLGGMSFGDSAFPSGVGTPSLNHLKFGLALADLDGDGKLDIYQGDGHVFDNVAEFNDIDKFEQVDQVFVNAGAGRFREVPAASGAFPDLLSVTRGIAGADFNDDGATDLLINSLNRPVRLLENRRPRAVRWVGLKLIGTRSNRDGIGARVELRSPAGIQAREVTSGGSYASQSDFRVLFDLGDAAATESLKLSVRWPSGVRQQVSPVTLDRYVTVEEPR